MERWLDRVRKHDAGWFLLMGGLALLTFVTFNILFAASRADDYPREVIAALIGTIMAAVITQILLRQQSKGVEARERSVEVFRRKINTYDAFIEQALSHLEDDELSDKEAHALRRKIYNIALLGSSETVGTVTSYVRATVLQDDETGIYADIYNVVEAFRLELGLDKLEGDDGSPLDEMRMIDDFLNGRIDSVRARQSLLNLSAFRDKVFEALIQNGTTLFEGMDRPDMIPSNDGAHFGIERRPGTAFGINAPYAEDGADGPYFGYFSFEEMPPREQTRLKQVALNRNFFEDNDNVGFVTFCVMNDDVELPTIEDHPILTVAQFIDAIIEIERSTDKCGLRPREPS